MLVSRDCSIRLPRVNSEDKAQHADGGGSSDGRPKRPRAWRRWIGVGFGDDSPTRASTSPAVEQLDVHATLSVLHTLLDSSALPNGVVELLIDDFEDPTRQLFDIQDSHITLIEPGAAVPWASIAGSATAWALALGPARDPSALQLTGDTQLARRVLAALPSQDA
jgi:hypothetical protein